MIVTRTPLRMSFAGGGSDIKAFYQKNGGAVISTSIDKYIYICLNKKFDGRFRLSYSKTEHTESVNDLQHPLVRESLKMLKISDGLEMASIADIPSKGTGLGSSSAFTVGLLHALMRYKNKKIRKEKLAELACEIEINKCDEPIGKQDQYASAFGDLNFIQFLQNDQVKIQKINCSESIRSSLEERILVFYTGITRNSSDILDQQTKNLKNDEKISVMKKMVALSFQRQ